MEIEKRSIDYVPLAERHGRVWHLWPVWFVGGAHLATLAVGVLGIALGGNLLWTAVAVIAGCALGTFFMAFHATQGPQLGLPQMIQSRPQFGYMGALSCGESRWSLTLATTPSMMCWRLRRFISCADSPFPATSTTIIVFSILARVFGGHRLRLDSPCAALSCLLLIAILVGVTIGAVLVIRLPAGQFDVHGFRAVPFLSAVLCRSGVSAQLVHLRLGLFTLPAARRRRARIVLVDLRGTFIGGTWTMLVGTFAASMHPHIDVAAAMQNAADAVMPGLGTLLLSARSWAW